MIELSENTSLRELQALSFWEKEEILQESSSAGPSNMNLVLRIKTSNRSVILKQSKPYVRKFPQIPAPIQRIQVEFEFLQLLENHPLAAKFVPKILAYDASNHILLTEDLGKGKDFSGIYSGEKSLNETDISTLMEFINVLHGIQAKDFPDNMDMRILNHEHIFHFPFQKENGFDLDSIQPGLQKLSLEFKHNELLKEKIESLGKQYLSKGETLLHGDFYPGSWLEVSTGLKVIDPEFGFMGDREFDLGVFLAHLDLGQQKEDLKNQVISSYSHSFNLPLLKAYRGVEILRRLIGIAQVPVNMTLSQKEALLNFAKSLIIDAHE
ncbi:phosphotransferase [Algoriphagus mannitolivorans]|uniref:phosphotransferase n=1 Tax=Algoriphagus mannitolivorans TaxID=226504 RepID=UPI0004063BA4|nr:phosphotransferase [Algoriphagus mannitolivorans]